MNTLEELGISPAPWRAEGGAMAAIVYENKPTQECGSVCAIVSAQRDADARLIAAAPELYEALRRIISDNKCRLKCGTCAVTDRCDYYPAVKAIEKAGGAE